MIKAGVIGHPVAHSLSPVIHSHWLDKYGVDGGYEARHIAADGLGAGIQRLVDDGFAGFNVTLPHKVAIMDHCAIIDETAGAVGAANTITIDKQGALHAGNSDVYGFIQHLKASWPDFADSDGAALILGAGGAARAAIYALLSAGWRDIRIANRTAHKAQALADEFGITQTDWQNFETELPDTALLVNTTPCGMFGQGALHVKVEDMPENAAVYDLVYRPQETRLLADARASRLCAVDGLGMLIQQAKPGFMRWFGVEPEIDDALYDKLDAVLDPGRAYAEYDQ
jgi:shikimate dehydrogenase